ncbi:hypothetical protein AAW14_19120 [Streptomyces hygroscopicus]|uniref:DUF1648 domain-containing protein n=1 Tax=Streptomyces hygroscopicus TaxID=1912 RepID=UPI00223ECA97|nr:DUF1648 domain-containing protein [Streptomyces hygroscopicus]MCW7944086.1 hypothetical protein [Streptomyces hygroscopicus]
MNDRTSHERAVHWGTAIWTAGAAGLIAALPWAASGRLPDRVATHWGSGSDAPDGSMPLWAASLVPALIWLVLALVVALVVRRTGAAARPWTVTTLLFSGTLLVGAQISAVRANLGHGDWHQARLPTVWVVVAVVAAAVAGGGGWVLGTRGRPTPRPVGRGRREPALAIPEGQRLVWFSRATNPWFQALAAVTGLVAVSAGAALVGGLAAPGLLWSLFVPFALVSLAAAGCASVQARVSEQGLEVAFGPLGWPVRRWAARDIESARAERRTPAQAGGWGYRLSSLGTTVMVRGGECLVVRARDMRAEFAVSVDDAERGAALLNALYAHRPG